MFFFVSHLKSNFKWPSYKVTTRGFVGPGRVTKYGRESKFSSHKRVGAFYAAHFRGFAALQMAATPS